MAAGDAMGAGGSAAWCVPAEGSASAVGWSCETEHVEGLFDQDVFTRMATADKSFKRTPRRRHGCVGMSSVGTYSMDHIP
jgi:hypothetical protein